MTIKHQTKYRC